MILDLRLGQVDGVELAQNLAALAPEVRIVGYAFEDDSVSVGRFLESGGHAFVGKEAPCDALIEAIEQTLVRGDRTIDEQRSGPHSSA